MRLIDADAFKTQVAAVTALKGLNVEKAALLLMLIDQQPTIDAQPVVHARWLDSDGDGIVWCCSACHHPDDWRTPYCAHCGARMDADRVDANGDAKERVGEGQRAALEGGQHGE